MKRSILFLFIFLMGRFVCPAQLSDTAVKKIAVQAKSNTIHSPRKATIRSAIIPGWGQYYNKKYWKIPIVYAALGTCGGLFVYNLNEYNDARNAYRYKIDNDPTNDQLIKDKFRPVDPESIRRYRNDVRQNVDYSLLAILICWGLNVVDATVDGHLKSFEVGENLSLQLMPPRIQPANGFTSIGLTLTWHKQKQSK